MWIFYTGILSYHITQSRMGPSPSVHIRAECVNKNVVSPASPSSFLNNILEIKKIHVVVPKQAQLGDVRAFLRAFACLHVSLC